MSNEDCTKLEDTSHVGKKVLIKSTEQSTVYLGTIEDLNDDAWVVSTKKGTHSFDRYTGEWIEGTNESFFNWKLSEKTINDVESKVLKSADSEVFNKLVQHKRPTGPRIPVPTGKRFELSPNETDKVIITDDLSGALVESSDAVPLATGDDAIKIMKEGYPYLLTDKHINRETKQNTGLGEPSVISHLKAEALSMRASPSTSGQILMNLVADAVQATPSTANTETKQEILKLLNKLIECVKNDVTITESK